MRTRLSNHCLVLWLSGLLIIPAGCSASKTAPLAATTPPAKTAPLAVTTPQPSVREAVHAGWRHLEDGSPERAAQAFRAVLRSDPAAPEARFGLAEVSRRSGKNEEALNRYGELLGNPEYRSRALEGVGLVKLQTGDREGAKAAFEQAIETNRGAWRAWLGMAQLRDLAHDWTRADEAYAAALAASNKPHIVHNNRGISLMARGKPGDAVGEFEAALQIDRKFEAARTNLDLANAALGRTGDGSEEVDPVKRASKLNNAGYVAMIQGDFTGAETLFRQALASHPQFYGSAYQNLNALRSMQHKPIAAEPPPVDVK
jgi:Tfp pilus assembly protein PilF